MSLSERLLLTSKSNLLHISFIKRTYFMKLIFHSRNESCFLTRYDVCTTNSLQKEAFPFLVLIFGTIHPTTLRPVFTLRSTFCCISCSTDRRTAPNCKTEREERSNSTTEPDDACRDIDRVTRGLTPGHSTQSNFIYGMRGYCTARYMAKHPVGLWGPSSHSLNEYTGPSLGGKAEGLPG